MGTRMSNTGFGFLVLLSTILSASGLLCWKCENHDLRGCLKHGQVEKCRIGDAETCQTEVRYFEHKKVIVKTGCKQDTACVSNNIQNPAAAWTPTQCNEGIRNSVCRCCCEGNLCNKRSRNLLCVFQEVAVKNPPVTPPSPTPVESSCAIYPAEPKDGKRSCVGGYALRAFCRFSCNEGYELIGHDISVCVKRGRVMMWNRGAPACERRDMCRPNPDEPNQGHVACDDDGRVGTVCKFSCNSGYELVGDSGTECIKASGGPEWSHKTPKCKQIKCNPKPKVPADGEIYCDGQGELGTTCHFTCNYGFKLKGSQVTTCMKSTGGNAAKWSHNTPACEKLVCSDLPRDPVKGFKECSAGMDMGSTCSFACEIGYELDGSSTTTCEKTLFGMQWSHRVPRCKPVCKTLPEEPENGFKNCKGDGDLGTVCTFDCKPGHEMRGTSATVCELRNDGANWSNSPPRCEPVCKPLPESPENGRKKCDGNGEVGTTCTFVCDARYKLDGSPETTCELAVGGADWSNDMPSCIPFCELTPESPQNGKKYCIGGGEVGTTCTFDCHSGFRRRGAYATVCKLTNEGANWSEDTPKCEPVCSELPKAPQNGSVECSGTGELGTVCTFKCDSYGYVLEGSREMICTEGESRLKWDNEEPICTARPRCSSLGNMPFGDIECTNELSVEGTVCSFQCLEVGFSLVPPDRSTIECQSTGADLFWNATKPCCVDCSKAKRDIVIAMDSSGSIDPREWKDMMVFVQNLVRKFEVSENAVQFSIFQFSSAPRSDGLMYFGRYPKAKLMKQIGKMRRIGSGTKTGKALAYARRRLRDRGNRKGIPDMVLVLTDGAAEDSDDLMEVSKELRDSGVEILALAIGSSDDFVEQMIEMTGSTENVLKAGQITDLTAVLADTLFKKTCQDEKECLR